MHGFILVPAAGPYIQQRRRASALYYLAPGVLVVGGTSEAREGGRLPSLLLEEELSVASSDVGGRSEYVLRERCNT